MAGAALSQLGAAAMGLVGLVSILRARRAGRIEETDPVADKRLAERMEMERRMASYIASRDPRFDAPDPRQTQNQGASHERS